MHTCRLGLRAAVLAVALAVSATAPLAAVSPFRPGPTVLDQVPTGMGEELGFVARPDAAAGHWPAAVLARVRGVLAGGGGVLAVGQTNPIGPRSLNRSLGLQYATQTARLLAAELGADLTRFACAARGEVEDEPPGVVLVAWRSALPASAAGGRLVVLEPLPGTPSRGFLWGIWQGAARRMLLAHDLGDGPAPWEVSPRTRWLRMPVPARSPLVALAGDLAGGGREARQVEVAPSREDAQLRLRLEAVEEGWVRARVRVPQGYLRPLVWAGGVPYRLVPDSRRDAEVKIARTGVQTTAYAQAVAPDGGAVVGPELFLPDDGSPLPDFVAVLVWEGEDVDLDLHVWDGVRHTQLHNPDAAYSNSAVAGARLLFDGDSWTPASAVVAWGQEPPEVEVRCYSDLGGDGAVGWLYVIRSAGDPIARSLQILGPRRLSEEPTRARWPALRGAAVTRASAAMVR